MAVQKAAEKPYTEPSIGQHLRLLKTGKGLRNLFLAGAGGDIKLMWHALDKLVERGDWLELWEAILRSKENSPERDWAKERFFSRNAEEKKMEKIGDAIKHHILFSKHKQPLDAQAAEILSDWMAKNNMWRQLMSMSLFGDKNLQNAAKERFQNLTMKEADRIMKLDGHLAFDIWHEGVKDPEVKKHLEGRFEKGGGKFCHG